MDSGSVESTVQSNAQFCTIPNKQKVRFAESESFAKRADLWPEEGDDSGRGAKAQWVLSMIGRDNRGVAGQRPIFEKRRRWQAVPSNGLAHMIGWHSPPGFGITGRSAQFPLNMDQKNESPILQ
jgi:hypothetical protein